MFDGGVVKEHNKLRIVSEESHSLQINHWSCIMLFGHQWLAPGVCRLVFSTRIHDAGAPRQLSHSLQSEYCLFYLCLLLFYKIYTTYIYCLYEFSQLGFHLFTTRKNNKYLWCGLLKSKIIALMFCVSGEMNARYL
jgi:hypothetical protein